MKKNGINIIILILVILIIIIFAVMLIPSNNEKPKEDSLIFKTNMVKVDIKKGETTRINYELNKEVNISWESSNPNVATVVDGNVSAMGIGSTTITGRVNYNNEVASIRSIINVYEGNKGVNLLEISFPTNELVMRNGDTFVLPITYNPSDGYVTSITYKTDNNNILKTNGNKIEALFPGECNVRVTVNDTISKVLHVIVLEEQVETRFVNPLEKVIISRGKIELEIDDKLKIDYQLEPVDGYVYSTKWESSDNQIVSVNNDGELFGLKEGEAVVTLTINNKFIAKINVKVGTRMQDIKINSSTNLNMKIGDTSQIVTTIVPSNTSNKKLVYKSSNGNVIVSDTGLIKAIKSGKALVTVSSPDGRITKTITVNVLQRTGVIGGDGIWAYTDSKTVTPVRAGTSFFSNLANKGIGSISGNTYHYGNYTYNIDNSSLTSNDVHAMVRIYYASGIDLSLANTFTFIGGAGERNWGSFFSAINRDPSMIKTGGIVILISGKNGYSAKEAKLGTDFVKAITKQKSGVRNAVGGYSMGGPAAGEAFASGGYDSLFVVCSYFNGVAEKNIKNKEIYVYSPVGDSMLDTTINMLNKMKSSGYNNVTVVTNNSKLINDYSSNMLIVNPGRDQGSGHGYNNIVNSNMFAFACK
ncbi:MAG: Ig domain-containing protein [Bacilli bacterium]|nr:Ig domain-containing protein [Bacilli bacterium]